LQYVENPFCKDFFYFILVKIKIKKYKEKVTMWGNLIKSV